MLDTFCLPMIYLIYWYPLEAEVFKKECFGEVMIMGYLAVCAGFTFGLLIL